MIRAFLLWKEVDEFVPTVRKQHLNAAWVIRPVELDIAHSEYAAQN
jgi:hypothetical protein